MILTQEKEKFQRGPPDIGTGPPDIGTSPPDIGTPGSACIYSPEHELRGWEILFLGVGKPAPEEPFFAFVPGEGDQGIDIAFSGDGAVKDDGADGKQQSGREAPEIKEGS